MAVEKYRDPATGEWVETRAPVSKGAPKFHASQHAVDGTDPLTPEMIGAMSMELLWENASPATAFEAQTISIDFSGYSLFVVVCKGSVNYQYETAYLGHVGKQAYASMIWGDSGTYYGRSFICSETGMTINDGYSNKAVLKSCLIPYRIYGIKGVTE